MIEDTGEVSEWRDFAEVKVDPKLIDNINASFIEQQNFIST